MKIDRVGHAMSDPIHEDSDISYVEDLETYEYEVFDAEADAQRLCDQLRDIDDQ